MTLNQQKYSKILQYCRCCQITEELHLQQESPSRVDLEVIRTPVKYLSPLHRSDGPSAGLAEPRVCWCLRCCHKHILASRARQTAQPANRVMLGLVPIPSCQPGKRGSRTRMESWAQQQQTQEWQGVGRELLTARAGTLPLVTHPLSSVASRNAATGNA